MSAQAVWNVVVRLLAQAVTSLMHRRIRRTGQYHKGFEKSYRPVLPLSSSYPILGSFLNALFAELPPLLVPHRSTRHDTDASHLNLKPFGARVRVAHLGQTILLGFE